MSEATGSAAPRDAALPGGAVLVLAAIGAVAAWALASPAPDAPGARRLFAPETLLSLFDAAAVLLLVESRRGGPGGALVLAAVAAPFHVAIAAAAGAGAGFHAAIAGCAGAWALALGFASRRAPRFADAAAVTVCVGLPLAAYGLGEFARMPVGAALMASPLTAPVLLSHRAPDASPVDALPALAAASVVARAAAWLGRRAGRGAERGA